MFWLDEGSRLGDTEKARLSLPYRSLIMRMIRVIILLLPLVLIQTVAATARPAARKTAKKAPVYRGFNPSGPWLAPDYSNPAEGDQVDGDDLAVRRAAAAKENSTTRRTARASGKAE